MYSDSQSSQQSVVLGSLVDGAPPPAQCMCSPPMSMSDGPVLPHSLPSLGAYQQSAVVSQPSPPVPESLFPWPRAYDGLSSLCWLVVRSQPHKSRLEEMQGCRLEQPVMFSERPAR